MPKLEIELLVDLFRFGLRDLIVGHDGSTPDGSRAADIPAHDTSEPGRWTQRGGLTYVASGVCGTASRAQLALEWVSRINIWTASICSSRFGTAGSAGPNGWL